MSEEDKIIAEERMIEAEFQALINDYLNSNHRRKVERITKAFNMAKEAHKGARRRSGEPYIMHPLAVARIVSKEMGLGSTSISAALLHDVVEDTDYTVEDLEQVFGDKIAHIVDGLTKISHGMFGENVSAQAENFRKLLLTMSEDIRVILIKIADRLHNMRTLASMSPAKQFKISGETLYIYAPLAHRLGLFAIKTELEELCFKHEHPETYQDLVEKIEQTAPERSKVYKNFAKPVVVKLDQMDIEYEMRARIKSVYSIWKKMEAKNIEFSEIYDLFAVRIIFEVFPGMDEKKQCWDIYSAITDIYKLRPDRIRDWVSHPKANGYQALHLTVMGPDGKWIEIQIRSRRMDDIAEKGFAAHWKYKETKVEEDNELEKWLKTVQEVLANPNPNAIDFLDTVKMNLFASEIFVFTPRGEIKTLPMGATALDFAYNIHTRVGDTCLGAKVNHRLVPLSEPLKSGDQVEIITSNSQEPKREWLNFVTTAKARTKIEASLRRQRRQIMEKGENMLLEFMGDTELDNSIYNKLHSFFNIEKREDLFLALGDGEVKLPDSIDVILKQKAPQPKQENLFMRYMKQMGVIKKSQTDEKVLKSEEVEVGEDDNNGKIDPKKVYKLEEVDFRKNFIVAKCCNPLPGDEVFGYITDNNEVEVHKQSCSHGIKLKSNYGEKIIEVEWGDYKQYSFLSAIVFSGIDRVGILNEILSTLQENIVVNIQSVNVSSKDGIFDGILHVHVHSAEDVSHLSARIAKVDGVKSVHRALV